MNKIKENKNLVAYISMAIGFLLLILIATRGSAPYESVAFEFGDFSVQWYAVFILFGIVFAAILGFLELERYGQDPNIIWDGLLIFVPLSILGARLWYVLFNLDKYNGNIGRMLNVGEGGLAIHGAIAVVFVGLIWFTKFKKVDYFFVLDIVGPGFLIGQAMGRWGNFMNRELYGPVLENPNWLPPFIKENLFFSGKYHHPTFLYESSWNILGLILILVFRRKKFVKLGDILAFYLVWYGVGRIPNEILRMASGVKEPLMLFNIPVSIATSVALILAGILVFIIRRLTNKNIISYDDYGKKAVLFDLDGTLLDTIDLIYKNIKETFKIHFPNKKLSDEELRSFVGPTLDVSFGWYEKDPEKITKMIDTYRNINEKNHHDGVDSYNNAELVLKTLKERNYKIGVVSSKINKFVRLGLEQNGLISYIDIIIGSDDSPVHKPDPLPLQMALEKLSVKASNAAYVGDHPNDIFAAQNANMMSIGVSYSIHYKELLGAKPDQVIDDLEKLLYIFN
ncbi:prolipoprotein diacylglyceryl transferase [Acholeplasma granularum]|uniref:prolipoprotein diacylglyceryl transferase n=1 Tax=Acholeplasma granularum TaxID=264635 RepID=UPI0004B59DEF|nr:prolipoprotein diacylglyceryl transferase [Acholeplasma granularum]